MSVDVVDKVMNGRPNGQDKVKPTVVKRIGNIKYWINNHYILDIDRIDVCPYKRPKRDHLLLDNYLIIYNKNITAKGK